MTKAAEIRAGLSHPIIDADGHFVEVAPLLNEEMLTYLEEMGGPEVRDRYALDTGLTDTSTVLAGHPGARGAGWNAMPSWWGWATENTRDRATAHLPALLYERLDEIGIDFTILYPSMTLAYLEVADDELIGLRCRAANRALANLFAPYRDRTTVGALVPMLDPKLAVDELEYAVRELGFKTAVFAGSRPAPDRRGRRLPARHVRRRQRVRLRPALGEVRRARYRARVPQLAAVAPRDAIGNELRVQPHRWPRRESRIAVQVVVPLRRDAPLPHAALRIPRRRRRLGVQPARRPRRPLGEAQRAARSARSIPTGSTSTRSSRCSSGTATTECTPGSAELRAYFTRPSARPEQLDEFAAAALTSVADIRDRFVPNFYFGCEADDRLVAWAFAEHVNRGRRATPADLRLRHLALGRARHDRAGRGGVRARRRRRDRRARVPRADVPQPGAPARRDEPRLLRRHRCASARCATRSRSDRNQASITTEAPSPRSRKRSTSAASARKASTAGSGGPLRSWEPSPAISSEKFFGTGVLRRTGRS